MRNAGALVSANLHMLEFQQKLQHALTLNDVRGACQMCFQGSTELVRLCEHGCSVEAAARVATSSFLDSILVLATSGLGKPEQQRQKTSPTKSAISSMIATVSEHARNPAFIASAMVDNEMADLAAVLDPAVDPAKLQDVFDRFDGYHQHGASSRTELGPLGAFLFVGVIGKGLVEFARVALASETCDVDASKRTSEVEASGQAICGATWNPFNKDSATVALSQHLKPFKDALRSLAECDNPVFNDLQRKKDKRFKLTDRHQAMLGRVAKASEDTWSHLADCVVRQFEAHITKSAIVVARALGSNGEVELEASEGAVGGEVGAVGRVGLLDLKWLEVEVDAQVSGHALFSDDEGSAQVVGSKHFRRFRDVTLAVASICEGFLELAECGLANNIARFRDLSQKHEWSAAELKRAMDCPKRVETFAGQQGLKLDARVHEALATLAAALRPAFARSQKEFFGAARAMVGLYSEGKEVPDIAGVMQRIAEPLAENKVLFDFIRDFLRVADASAGITKRSGADACVVALQGLAQVLEQWPMKLEDGCLLLKSEWAAWEGDLRFLGFNRPELLKRVEDAHAQISKHVHSQTEDLAPKLRCACDKAAQSFPCLAGLLHRSESDFKKDMKTLAPILAKTQATIRAEHAACNKFSASNLGVALGTELGTLAEHVMGAIQYFVGVYTALMFYRHPDTWAPKLETAKKNKAALVAALSSLNDSDDASAFEGMCAHTVVAQMRRDAQVPAREVPHRQGGPLAVWAAGPLDSVKKGQGASEEEQEPGQGRWKRRRREVSAGMVAVSPPAACEVEKAIVAEGSVAQSMAVPSGAAEAQGDLAASGQAEAASGQAEACPASTTKAGEEQAAEEAGEAGEPASVAGAGFFLVAGACAGEGPEADAGAAAGPAAHAGAGVAVTCDGAVALSVADEGVTEALAANAGAAEGSATGKIPAEEQAANQGLAGGHKALGQVAERMGETAVEPATDSASAVAESGASGHGSYEGECAAAASGHVSKPKPEAAAKPAAKPKETRGAAKAQALRKDRPGIVVAPKPLGKKKARPKAKASPPAPVPAAQALDKLWSRKG